VAFWKHHPGSDQTAAAFTEATLAFQAAVASDLVKLTPPGTYQANALGLIDAWTGDALGRRSIVRRPVIDPGDWRITGGGPGLGRIEEACLETAAAVRAALDPEVPVIATVFGPATLAVQLAGAEALAAHFAADPSVLADALSRLAERVAALVAAFAEAGADGIFLVDQHSAQPPLAAYGRWYAARAIDGPVLAAASRLPFRILHYHGGPLGTEVGDTPPGWTVHYEWRDDTPEPREIVAGPGRPLMLPLPLEGISAPASAADRRAAIRAGLAHAGLVNALVTAPCVVPLAVPDTVLRQWADAVAEWGDGDA
jgi:uroporphyrinogen decarboxylase